MCACVSVTFINPPHAHTHIHTHTHTYAVEMYVHTHTHVQTLYAQTVHSQAKYTNTSDNMGKLFVVKSITITKFRIHSCTVS